MLLKNCCVNQAKIIWKMLFCTLPAGRRDFKGGTEMSFARILALASRIIRQVLRDRRTLALIFLVPLFVMTLLYFVLTTTSSVRTLAIMYPTGAGSDRINTLINALLPGPDKLDTISISSEQVHSTLQSGNADA